MSLLGKSGLLVLCLGVLAGGCMEDAEDSCSSDEKFENKVCVPDTGGDGDGDQSGDGDAQGGDDAGTQGVDATGFGDVCAADGECTTNAPYCAKQPGQTSGYCTRQNCTVEDPGATCPTSWTCFDLNIFSPGAGTMCRKPM